MAAPLRIALAVGEQHEATLLPRLEASHVFGRACRVTELCATVREVQDVLTRGEADVLVVSSMLNAVPLDTLRGFAERGTPLLVLAPDAGAWQTFPGAVIGLDAKSDELAAGLESALLHRSTGPANPAPVDKPSVVAGAAGAPLHQVITVCSAEEPVGRTTAAVGLAVALSTVASTMLIDANRRGSGVEFHLADVDPTRTICEVARKGPTTPAEWWRAIREELQDMGAPAHGQVLLGVTTPELRPRLTADVLGSVVQATREQYRFTVLDASGGGWTVDDDAADQLALQAADRLLLVVRPDVQSIARARRVLRRWPHRDRLSLIVNQVGLAGQVPVGDVEVRLGAPVAAILPWDPHRVAAARARQRPVVCEPGCRLATPLLELAGRIADNGPVRVPSDAVPEASPPWWRRAALLVTGVLR